MAKDLKKFANLTFLRIVDLSLMRRLFERHGHSVSGFDVSVFDGEPKKARGALRTYFLGPHEEHPESLVSDLFRIAELGNANGLELIIEAARRRNVPIRPADESEETKLEPKQVALRFFLDHPDVFNAASDLLSYATVSAPIELRGSATGVEAASMKRRKRSSGAKRSVCSRPICEAHIAGWGWYHEGDKVNVIVTHGAPLKTTEVIENGADKVVSFREVTHAVLSYSAATGKIEIGKISKGRSGDIAEVFARTMLKRPGFFEAPDARDLYTLAPVERAGFGFTINHAFDSGIRRVEIIDVQADRLALDPRSGKTRVFRSHSMSDSEGRALATLGADAPAIRFGPDWRLGQMSLHVHFETEERKPAPVKVTLKPPAIAKYSATATKRASSNSFGKTGCCVTESLAQLLLRRSEAGEPAILWGCEAKPFLGPNFDRLIVRGILSARAPAEEWQVCDACDCDLAFRPIEIVQGRLVAVCPRDRGSDLALEQEDLQSYTIEASALVREIAAASGFREEPSVAAPGVWGLGFLTGGRAVFLALSYPAIEQPGLVHAVKAVARSAPISLVAPRMPMRRISDFGDAGIDGLSITDVLARSRTAATLALDVTRLAPASMMAPVLTLLKPRLTAFLCGFEIQLPPRSFELLWLLAETVARGGGIVTRRQIEQRLWGTQAVAKTAAADAIRDLREQLAGAPRSLGRAKVIETRHGEGYVLALPASAIQLIE